MSFAQSLIAYFIYPAVNVFIFLIFAEVIFSWLLAFNVINLRNPTVAQLYDVVRRVTNPILEPIRKVLPNMGGLDFSPIIALFGLSWANGYLFRPIPGINGGVLYNLLG